MIISIEITPYTDNQQDLIQTFKEIIQVIEAEAIILLQIQEEIIHPIITHQLEVQMLTVLEIILPETKAQDLQEAEAHQVQVVETPLQEVLLQAEEINVIIKKPTL